MSNCFAHAHAPVVAFIYNRPGHTRLMLTALAQNDCASSTELLVFADDARTAVDAERVALTRSIAREAAGFSKVTVIEREGNWGLAANVIDGISRVLSDYPAAIFLEDDIVTGPGFLTFMNQSLARYRGESAVWHIAGWSEPISSQNLEDAYFTRIMNCWGWATWADRWKSFRRDPLELIDTWPDAQIHQFNLDGAHDYWSQVEGNAAGRMNTWAVFWYATIFGQGGLCVAPTKSLCMNVGLDGSGEHTGPTRELQQDPCQRREFRLPDLVIEDPSALDLLRQFYLSRRPSTLRRVLGGSRWWIRTRLRGI